MKKIWLEEAKNFIYFELGPDQIPMDRRFGQETVAPDSAYISVFLDSISVPYSRRGTGTYFGAVHSFISIPYRGTGTSAQFNMFIAPQNLRNIDKSHVDRVITGRNRLLGPIPYRGGDIEIELGLFSIRSSDLAGPFLKVLENMASAAGVSSVNMAIPFVRPILEGVNELFGATDAILEIGRSETLNKPRTGYFVVMQAQIGIIDISTLKLEQDGRLYDPNSNRPVGYPYMIFDIQALDRRDEWFTIPELFNAHEKIKAAVRDRDVSKAEDAFTSFKIIVSTSPDLIGHDASKLITEVEGDLKKIFPIMTTGAQPELRLRELSELDLYSRRNLGRHQYPSRVANHGRSVDH